MTGLNATSTSMAEAYIGQRESGTSKSSAFRAKLHPHSSVPINILHDPRVFHGNTRAIARKYTNVQGSKSHGKKKGTENNNNVSKVKRKLYEDKEKQHQYNEDHPIYDVKVIDPLKKVIDFSLYLEEQKAPVYNQDNETQTDEFYEKAVPPNVIPGKVGIDNSTEIQTDLFDWDQEVTSIVNTLTSKIMEQALLEVEQEEELKEIETDIVAATGVKEYKDSEIMELEVEKRGEIEGKQKTYRDARLVYRAEKRLASKVFGLQLFREELPQIFSSLYDELELTGTWISTTAQEERLKKEKLIEQNEIDEKNKVIVNEIIVSVIKGALEKQVALQRSARK